MKGEDKMKKFAIPLLVLCIGLIAIPLHAEKVSVLTEVNKPETIQFGSGNIYILEGTTVYIYDEVTYKYKGKFGKEGEGPGEIKKNPFGGPLVMVPYKGKVTISSTGKYSVFSKDGEFEKEMKINAFDNFYPFEDIFICLSTYSPGQGELYLAVYKADKDFKKAKEPLVVTDTMVGQSFKLVFPFTAFAPFPYKDKLYIAPDPKKFTIEVYDKNVKKINTITKEYKRKKLPGEYRQKTLQWFKTDPNWRNAYESFKRRITFRDYYPPIFTVLVDNDKIYVPTFNFDKKGDRECVIMDLEGKELKRVYLPMKESYGMEFSFPYNIYKDNFYIIMENLDDETWELHKVKI